MKGNVLVRLLVVCMFLFAQPVYAEEPIRVTIDNVTQEFTQPPIFVDGHVLVPVKSIMEGLKGAVVWDAQNTTVHIFKDSVALSVREGSKMATRSYYDATGDAYINPETVVLDFPPQIVQGTMLVDIVDLKVLLDVKALWDKDNNVVRIFTDPGDVSYLEYKRELEPDAVVSETKYTADKYGMMIQVGDVVTTLGFFGKVEQINGDDILVYWFDKTDLISNENVPFMSFLAGIKYGERSWIKNTEIAVVQNY